VTNLYPFRLQRCGVAASGNPAWPSQCQVQLFRLGWSWLRCAAREDRRTEFA